MANRIITEWQEALKLRNEELKEKDLLISVTNVGEGYFNIDLFTVKNNKWIGNVVQNDFEDELFEDINMSYRVALDHYEKENTKLYAVTYVGLSDDDYDANGYTEVKVCASLEKAKKLLKEMRDNEIECQQEAGFDVKVLNDEDDECRLSWSGDSQQVRIEIHPVAEVLK